MLLKKILIRCKTLSLKHRILETTFIGSSQETPLATNLREAVPQTNVTFTGYLQSADLAEAYACSNIMVFPSATETFGNVVLESLACGTPVIGANSGVKNIITDGKREFFVP